MRRALVMALALVLTAVGCGSENDAALLTPRLQQAAEDVQAPGTIVEVSEDGRTMEITAVFGVEAVEVILDRLDAPSAVLAKMHRTRALDGTQEHTWGDFTASWTYHPDDGLNVVIEER